MENKYRNFGVNFYVNKNISYRLSPKESNNKQKLIKLNNEYLKNINEISTAKSTPNIFNNHNNLNMNLSKKIQIGKKNLFNNKINIKNHKRLNFNNNYYLKKNINQNLINFPNKNLEIRYNTNKSFIDDLKYINDSNINYEPKFFLKDKIFSNKGEYMDEYAKNFSSYQNVLINTNKSKPSIVDDDNSIELSEIAGEIVNSFPVRKNLKHSNSYYNSKHKITNKTKKLILPKEVKKKEQEKIEYKKVSPKNYTFKTVFVNNFCLLPVNSSIINKNNRYGKSDSKSNNNYINTTSNENNLKLKENFSNYQYPVHMNERKQLLNNNHSMKNIKNIKIKQSPGIKDNNSYLINKSKKINVNYSLTERNSNNNILKNIKNINDSQSVLNNVILKDNDFNEDYYYTIMDLSKLNYNLKKNPNSQFKNNNENKKHIKFDLSKNTLFIYNEKDYISRYKKYSANKKTKTRNLIRKNFKPIIKKFNKNDIKKDENYVLKENLDEDEIISEFLNYRDKNIK